MSTTARLPRELILASAGSGKTFRISSRVIGLLARGESPATIFASTFTRKAAGEILDRVLVRLAGAALDPAAAVELAAFASLDDVAPPPPDPAFWGAVLQRTVRQLHRVDVGTLDAFFVRSVGVFGHDLGLPPRWGIADETMVERTRAQALQEVLAAVDDGVRVELVRGLAAGAARRAVLDALGREVDGLLAVHYDLDPDGPGWAAIRGVLADRPADLTTRCAGLADRIRAAAVPARADGSPDTRWRNALDDVAAGVAARDWDAFLGKSLFCNALDDPEKGYYRVPIPPDIVALMGEAAVLARHDLASDYARRADAMARLAGLYADAYDRAVRAAGALRFDDVTRLLSGPAPLAGRADLFYRLDGPTRHVLLDEFQDTSLLQWQALRPLLDALTAAAGTATGGDATGGDAATVVVADPKQSIYGWRGAAPILVHAAGERYALRLEVLAESWRSSQVVLDAVNVVFGAVAERAAFDEHPADRAAAADWARDFAAHQARKTLPGHVRLLAGPRDEGRSSARPLLCQWTAQQVAELRDAAPGRSIGVLARTNATVARIMFELRELGVPASEEGGAPLTDSAAVASVLALLRLADHPGDTLSAYHVARTPLGPAVGLEDPADRRAVRRAAYELRRRLVEHGYGQTLARIARLVHPSCDARERARLGQLVALGFRYDERATLRADDFVRVAATERIETPARTRVRVMTVHQAKGLEFDIVVLPELEAELTRNPGGPRLLAYRPTGAGPVTHVFPAVRSEHRRLFDDIAELAGAHEQARAAAIRDTLSTLYVAMTRARYALHMIIAEDREKGAGTARTYARLVRDALVGPPDRDAPAREGDVLYESGDRDWHRTAPPPTDAPAEDVLAEDAPAEDAPAEEAPAEEALAAAAGTGAGPPGIRLRSPARRSRMLPRAKPSDLEAGATIDLAGVLGLGIEDAGRLRGSVVHAWLERVRWSDEGLPPAEELARIARRVAPAMSADAVAELRDWLRRRLDAPAVRGALARERYPDDAVVETEIPFLRRHDDRLLEGVLDRLVLVREAGRIVAAEVLDYKTDAIETGDTGGIEDAVVRYSAQLGAYRAAVAELYRIQPAAVRGTLIFLTPGVVREVG